MTRNEIINKVRVYMDEISPFENIEVINNPMIDSLLEDTANDLLLITPEKELSGLLQSMSGLTINPNISKGYGYIELPSTFLRALNLKFSEWERPVTNFLTSADPSYKLQWNKFTMSRGVKPMAYVTTLDYEGVYFKRIEYFGMPEASSQTLDYGSYVNRVTDVSDISDNLIDPLCWLVAAKAFQIIGSQNESQAATAKVMDWIKLRS